VAGIVGLALLATAGTLTMVSAGAGLLSASPNSFDLALGAPPAAWSRSPLLLPGTAGVQSRPGAGQVARHHVSASGHGGGRGTSVVPVPRAPVPTVPGPTVPGPTVPVPTVPVPTVPVPSGRAPGVGGLPGGSLSGTPHVQPPSGDRTGAETKVARAAAKAEHKRARAHAKAEHKRARAHAKRHHGRGAARGQHDD